jgi:hypothetical protein
MINSRQNKTQEAQDVMSHYEFYGKPFSFETRLGPWFAGRNNLTVINDVTVYHPARAIQMPAPRPLPYSSDRGAG